MSSTIPPYEGCYNLVNTIPVTTSEAFQIINDNNMVLVGSQTNTQNGLAGSSSLDEICTDDPGASPGKDAYIANMIEDHPDMESSYQEAGRDGVKYVLVASLPLVISEGDTIHSAVGMTGCQTEVIVANLTNNGVCGQIPDGTYKYVWSCYTPMSTTVSRYEPIDGFECPECYTLVDGVCVYDATLPGCGLITGGCDMEDLVTGDHKGVPITGDSY